MRRPRPERSTAPVSAGCRPFSCNRPRRRRRQTLRTEFCVLHARAVPFQVACGAVLAESRDDLVDLTVFKGVALLFRPRLRKISVTVDLFRPAPQVLFRMEQVDGWRLGTVRRRCSQSAPQNHASLGVVEAATARFALDPLSERRQFLVGGRGDADGAEPCSGVPSLCFSAVHTVTSLASRVLEEPSGCLPGRPSRSEGRAGTPVPSMPTYMVGPDGGSTSTLWRSSSSVPRASAIRSTILGATFSPANSFIMLLVIAKLRSCEPDHARGSGGGFFHRPVPWADPGVAGVAAVVSPVELRPTPL